MKYIYVLEDEPKFQTQIFQALRKTEPQAQIRYFYSLEQFQKWMAVALQVGQEALFRGGDKLSTDPDQMTASADPADELLLLISKEEWLGSRYLALIKKTHEMFLRKKLCTQEDPTRILISAFESPDFDIKLLEDRVITNVIFKPFDELILQQILHFALKGHHLPSESFVHKVQTNEHVEMTKEVQMEAVGDVGFVTRSPREIKVGQISKYYGDVFKSTGRTHVMGRCISSEPHPDHPGEFRVWFTYFGIPNNQISDIRKNMVIRNEIEYSANSPLKHQNAKMEWIIVDPHKDRVAKYKTLLEKTCEAQVKIFPSFDTFFFQIDPAGLENSRKEKAWVDTERIKLQLDQRGDKILHIFPEDQEKKRLFGEPFAEFQKHSFFSKLHEHSSALLRHWINDGQKPSDLIIVQNAGCFYTLKVLHLEKKTINGVHVWEMDLIEPHLAEKADWFKKQFPTPHSAHAILIADEYLYEEKLAFWEEFRKGAEVKGRNPRYMALYKNVPDEKFSRKLGWLEDIFEDSNTTAYLERKLKWAGGDSIGHHEDGSTSYLNSCKELVRVANPVEVAELSEGALVMNYHRKIDVGVFRKFVLSKSSETFMEYRAICNFSGEHPTEKEMFQSHFVFFGITDHHLKSIRLWILENYVHSKQEESGG